MFFYINLEKKGINGELLCCWTVTCPHDLRVVLKYSLSQLCDLTADIPQGSVLGPLLFLVYTNDITDDIIGFGRFLVLADYTSIGQFAPDEASLKKNKKYR